MSNYASDSVMGESSSRKRRQGADYSAPKILYAAKKPMMIAKAPAVVRAAVRAKGGRGYLRTGGFYGRYQGKNAEMKFFDTSLSLTFPTTAVCSTTAATGGVNLIAQGTGEQNRIGRKCTIKSMYIKGKIVYAPAAGATGADLLTLYVILDKQANGAYPGITDVFTANTDIGSTMLNLSNSERFSVLAKVQVAVNPAAGATTAFNNVVEPIHVFKRLNVPLEFSSTTGAITELKSNNIVLAYSAAYGNNLATLTAQCRLRFADN